MAGRSALLIAALAASCLPTRLLADAKSDYEMLFGEEETKVARTADTKDDAALAAKLLEGAGAVDDSPELQVLLCEKAFDLGLKHPGGHETSIAALRLLEKKAPERKAEWRRKLLTAYRSRYAGSSGADRDRAAAPLLELTLAFAENARKRGDAAEAAKLYRQALALVLSADSPLARDIRAILKAIQAVQRAERKLRTLAERLKKNPDDVKTRLAIVLCHVMERDRPQDAVELLNEDLDETLRTYVPLAAKNIDELAEPVCLELAEWYRRLAAKGSPHAKAVALVRARAYYTRYLQSHSKLDAARLKAKVALRELQASLDKLPVHVTSVSAGPIKIAFADKGVQDAYDKGIKYLWSRQLKNGSWPSPQNRGYPAGPSAMVTFALLESGVNAGEPRMAKALGWLRKQKTTRTYTLAWRCNAYLAASRTRKTFLGPLAKDVRQLLNSTRDGSFFYDSRGKPVARGGDLSNSQYGLFGIAAGSRGRVKVPKSYWQTAARFWTGAQQRDGGWAYRPGRGGAIPTMTAAGVVSSMICYTHAYGAAASREQILLKCNPAKSGLEWLDRMFALTMKPARRSYADNHYYLYGLSRVALATGRKQFGGVDWFEAVSKRLVATQRGHGAWRGNYGEEVSTAFVVLTLINGHKARAN